MIDELESLKATSKTSKTLTQCTSPHYNFHYSSNQNGLRDGCETRGSQSTVSSLEGWKAIHIKRSGLDFITFSSFCTASAGMCKRDVLSEKFQTFKMLRRYRRSPQISIEGCFCLLASFCNQILSQHKKKMEL